MGRLAERDYPWWPASSICQQGKGRVVLTGRLLRRLLLLSSVASLTCGAADWNGTAQLSTKGTYTDNLNLSDSDGGGDFFTEITPGVVLTGQGARLDLRLAYSLQYLSYLTSSDDDRVNHRLQASSQSEIVRERVFLDAQAAARQELIDRYDRFGGDATSPSDNLQTTVTYSITPRYVERLGRYATLTARAGIDGVLYSKEGDDSTGINSEIGLSSGSAFNDLSLDATLSHEHVQYDDGDEDQYTSIQGTVGYRLTRKWRVAATGGYEDNDYPSRDQTNGAIYRWTVTWTPGPRTTWQMGLSKRYFGWSPTLDLSHRHKRSSWTATYTREVASARTERLRTTVFRLEEDPDTGAILFVPVDTSDPSSSSNFVTNRFRSGYSLQGRRSSMRLSAGYVWREYEGAREDDGSADVRITGSRQLSGKTSANVGLGWAQQRRDRFDDEGIEELDQMSFDAGLSRTLSPRSSVNLQYRFRDGEDYQENRITVGFSTSWD